MDFLEYEDEEGAGLEAESHGGSPGERTALNGGRRRSSGEAGRGTRGPATPRTVTLPRRDTVWRIERQRERLFHEFVENTTLHGVKYVTNPEHSTTRRMIWMCLFGTMVVIVSCALYTHLTWYFRYPTKMAVTQRSPAQVAFPTVAMCNCQRFPASAPNGSSRRAGPASETEALTPRLLMEGLAEFMGPRSRPIGEVLGNVSGELRRRRDLRGADVRSLGLEMTPELGETLLGCRWEGRGDGEAGEAARCSAVNFTRVWTDYGVCHVYNGLGDQASTGQMVTSTGLDGGLWVRLNARPTGSLNASKATRCFKVAIKPRDDFYFVRDVERTVEPGSHAVIGLRKRVITSMEAPYDTECRKGGLKYFEGYSIGACRMECLTDDTMEKCGCIAPFMPESSGFPYCNLSMLITCVTRLTGTPFCPCHTPCSEVVFDERVSITRAPSHDFRAKLQNVLSHTTEEESENILEISVYFENLRELWTTHEAAYGIADLMSSIGGELGLFLGGSVITIFEFADFLLTRQTLNLRFFRSRQTDVDGLRPQGQQV